MFLILIFRNVYSNILFIILLTNFFFKTFQFSEPQSTILPNFSPPCIIKSFQLTSP